MKDLPLTTHHLICYFLPGFVFVFCFFMNSYPFHDLDSLKSITAALKDLSAETMICALIASFILGHIWNSIRTTVDYYLINDIGYNEQLRKKDGEILTALTELKKADVTDAKEFYKSVRDIVHPEKKYWFKKINWDYFYKADNSKVGILYSRYYTNYCFNGNMVFSLIASGLLFWCYCHTPSVLHWAVIIILLSIIILGVDFFTLRGRIADYTNDASLQAANGGVTELTTELPKKNITITITNASE